jgi:hypothetical protein
MVKKKEEDEGKSFKDLIREEKLLKKATDLARQQDSYRLLFNWKLFS